MNPFHAALATSAIISCVASQHRAAPDAHWGASLFPPDKKELRASIILNRFTVFSKDPASGQFNEGINKSAGFNMPTLSFTDAFKITPTKRFTYTLDLGLGWAGDQPTEFIQNDIQHPLLGIQPVAVGEKQTGFQWTTAGAANFWLGNTPDIRPNTLLEDTLAWDYSAFAGAGATFSSLYQEPDFHLGGALDLEWDTLVDLKFRVSALHRIGFPIPGDTYRDVASLTNTTQLSLIIAPYDLTFHPTENLGDLNYFNPQNWLKALHHAAGRPQVGFHYTLDSGIFQDSANDPIPIRFYSVSVEWKSGFRFEAWNDDGNYGGTVKSDNDWGPTYGMSVGFDILKAFR